MMESLLFPKKIAVIGASRNPGKVGHAILKNLIDGGFQPANLEKGRRRQKRSDGGSIRIA